MVNKGEIKMDYFVCPLDITATKQLIFLPDSGRIFVDTENFGNNIVALSREYENYSVKIVGNYTFAKGLIEDIKESELKLFSKNLIDIEYIGGK